MRLGKTEKDREALEELVRQNSSLGLDVRMVYGQDIRELIPDVSPEVQYATYCPTDGHANPMRTTLALYKRARELGAQFITKYQGPQAGKGGWKDPQVHTETGSMRQTASSCVRDLAPERSCAPWGWMSLCCLS